MKKVVLIFLTIIITLGSELPISAAQKQMINASSAIMVDATSGQVIYQQNANKQLPVASISKLLTVAVLHDELVHHKINLNTKVRVTTEIAQMSNNPNYSRIEMKEGQSYSVKQLLSAALVKSGDGATVALVTAGGDSVASFTTKMQKKAKELGLKKAHIINPTGLTNADMGVFKNNKISDNSENEMSATDVSILTRYLIKAYPRLVKIASQKKASFLTSSGTTKSFDNLNKMLPGGEYTVPGVTVTGLKTGTSESAGASFVSTANYKGHIIITVVLHANGDNNDARFVQTQKLYEMLKNDYHLQTIKVPQEMQTVTVSNGTMTKASAKPQRISVWTKKKIGSYTLSQTIRNKNKWGKIDAPVRKGQQVGTLNLTSSSVKSITNEPLTYPQYSNQNIAKGNFFQRFFH